MFTKTHKKNWNQQHPQLLSWASNGQFEGKMKWSLEKVREITSTFLSIVLAFQKTYVKFSTVLKTQMDR